MKSYFRRQIITSVFPIAAGMLFLFGCTITAPLTQPTENWKTIAEQMAAASIADLQTLSDAGNDDATVELGIRHVNGDGLPIDYRAAFDLFSRAAENNNAAGQYFIGLSYDGGMAVNIDQLEAVRWYERSAENKYPLAQYRLGMMIIGGLGGIAENFGAGWEFIQLAANQHHSDSEYFLATHYDDIVGQVETDFEKSAYWYRRAIASAFNQKAQFNLRRLIQLGYTEWQPGDPGNPPELIGSGGEKLHRSLIKRSNSTSVD